MDSSKVTQAYTTLRSPRTPIGHFRVKVGLLYIKYFQNCLQGSFAFHIEVNGVGCHKMRPIMHSWIKQMKAKWQLNNKLNKGNNANPLWPISIFPNCTYNNLHWTLNGTLRNLMAPDFDTRSFKSQAKKELASNRWIQSLKTSCDCQVRWLQEPWRKPTC